ncbi:MAG: N-acetylmuramic acid 6-phosphate etherase [Ruminococcaceae bacterium]|nr:N-acetylmuramic acid 6-phosphate etherase [Oscillospiraceae bacterium]
MNTENVNINSIDIDKKSTVEMISIINNEDKTVALAVEKAIPQIAKAVDVISEGLKKDGRLISIGAGTSGRLAIQDAAECTVTYGVPEGTVSAIMAGGRDAVFKPSENVEDNFDGGAEEIAKLNVGPNDTIVGISASGNAPYVCGALTQAKAHGANTVSLLCNEHGKIADCSDIAICVPTGAEVINGSTRMKAGTAQKMVLNMLSTASMIKLGKVTSNFMTWMTPTNIKLEKRARFIVSNLCNVSEEEADELLTENNYNIQAVVSKYRK